MPPGCGTPANWRTATCSGRGAFPGHATLVLDADADATASVTIRNSVDYEVCIDSSGDDVDLSSPSETACTATTGNTWHTTPVYDYDDGNDTAAITASAGAASPATAYSNPASITVEWTGC